MANCCICGKSPAKIVLSGISGKICSDCQKNISNIRSGKVSEAREYFDNINISSFSAKDFIFDQYSEYAYAAEKYSAENEAIKKIQLQEESVNRNMKDMILSTTPCLDGYRIIKYIDLVYSEAIYKLSLTKSFSTALNNAIDSFKFFSSTELSGTTQLIQEAKDYVKQDLIKKAAMLGANAIVGIDIESSLGSDGVAKASINGTAVIIEKID